MDGKSETYVEILSMALAKLNTPTQYHEIVSFSYTQLTRRMEGLLRAKEADPRFKDIEIVADGLRIVLSKKIHE
jgi:hypothetical protein